MVNANRKKKNDKPSRLHVVQLEARKRALFWDKTSLSFILSILAVVGLGLTIIGIAGLSRGVVRIGYNFEFSYGGSGWRYVVVCLCIIGLGLTAMMPLPLSYFLKERKATIICFSALVINFLVFMYAYIVDVFARGGLPSFL